MHHDLHHSQSLAASKSCMQHSNTQNYWHAGPTANSIAWPACQRHSPSLPLVYLEGSHPTMHDEGGRAYLQEGCSAQQDELQEQNWRWTQSETAAETAKQTQPLAELHHQRHPLVALLLLPSLLCISCCLKQYLHLQRCHSHLRLGLAAETTGQYA